MRAQTIGSDKLSEEINLVNRYFQQRNLNLEKIPAIEITDAVNCYLGFVDREKTSIQLSVVSDSVGRKVTLAHEFTHVYRSQFNKNEEVWLDEGLAKFIEYQFSSVWPVSYDDRLGKNSFLNLGKTTLQGGNNFSCGGDGYVASFYFVLYLYNHFGGEYLLRELLTSPHSGWENILGAIQSISNKKIITLDSQWFSKESLLRHFALAIWENDAYLAKYSLLKLDSKFQGLKNLKPKLQPIILSAPKDEVRIFYSQKYIGNSGAREIYAVFDEGTTTVRPAQPGDRPAVFIYLYY